MPKGLSFEKMHTLTDVHLEGLLSPMRDSAAMKLVAEAAKSAEDSAKLAKKLSEKVEKESAQTAEANKQSEGGEASESTKAAPKVSKAKAKSGNTNNTRVTKATAAAKKKRAQAETVPEEEKLDSMVFLDDLTNFLQYCAKLGADTVLLDGIKFISLYAAAVGSVSLCLSSENSNMSLMTKWSPLRKVFKTEIYKQGRLRVRHSDPDFVGDNAAEAVLNKPEEMPKTCWEERSASLFEELSGVAAKLVQFLEANNMALDIQAHNSASTGVAEVMVNIMPVMMGMGGADVEGSCWQQVGIDHIMEFVLRMMPERFDTVVDTLAGNTWVGKPSAEQMEAAPADWVRFTGKVSCSECSAFNKLSLKPETLIGPLDVTWASGLSWGTRGFF